VFSQKINKLLHFKLINIYHKWIIKWLCTLKKLWNCHSPLSNILKPSSFTSLIDGASRLFCHGWPYQELRHYTILSSQDIIQRQQGFPLDVKMCSDFFSVIGENVGYCIFLSTLYKALGHHRLYWNGAQESGLQA